MDAGFLELVRYGIRKAGDPLIEDSLRVVDSVLKVETPYGPCWRRYNHDGYGQRADGGPYQGSGKGRAWPLLTGERGHYELAAGRDPTPYLRALERFASCSGLLPEQIWDEPDRPNQHLFFGKPTGSATPLLWAHAEYIKLLRSAADGKIFDLIPVVAERYGDPRHHASVGSVETKSARGNSASGHHAAHPSELRRFACTGRPMNGKPYTIRNQQRRPWHPFCRPSGSRRANVLRFASRFFGWLSERWEGRDYAVNIQHKDTEVSTRPTSSLAGPRWPARCCDNRGATTCGSVGTCRIERNRIASFQYEIDSQGGPSETGCMNDALPIVYLARHGETAWSLTGRHTGTHRSAAHRRGERNARRLGGRLRGLTFRRCIHQSVAARDEDVRIGRLWRYFGSRSRSRRVELRRIRRPAHCGYSIERPDWQLFRDGCPGGETVEEVS